jgi:hypothetical protein
VKLQEICDALEAFKAAVEAGEMTGFKQGWTRSNALLESARSTMIALSLPRGESKWLHAPLEIYGKQYRSDTTERDSDGENLWGPHDLTKCLSTGDSDFVMLDVMKIGGITGWLRAIAQTEASVYRCRAIYSRNSARSCWRFARARTGEPFLVF